MIEEWKDIKDYEGLYQVSNLGRVRNKKRKIMIPIRQSDGYVQIGLWKNKKRKRHLVHRLVAKAFITNVKNENIVNHKNGIKNDNNVNNLEWISQSGNCSHAINLGLKGRYGRKIMKIYKFVNEQLENEKDQKSRKTLNTILEYIID